MRVLVPLPVVLPLLAAALNVLLARWQPLQRAVSVLTLTGVLVTAMRPPATATCVAPLCRPSASRPSSRSSGSQ